MIKKFPAEYPETLLEVIIKDGAKENTIYDTYRISYYGVNNRDAFLSTFFTNKNDSNLLNRDEYLKQQNILDIGQYSTSLSSNEKSAIKTLKMFQKIYNGPVLLKGTITPEFGLSMYTKDSISKRTANKYHIDWWLYENADPSKNFTVLKEE